VTNQAFLSETKRSVIIKALVDSTLDLTRMENLKKAVPNTSLFDVVGSIHYCHHTDSLPSRLLPLVNVYRAYGALHIMLQNTLKITLPPPPDLRPVTAHVTAPVTAPIKPVEPIKEAVVTKPKKIRTVSYSHVDHHELVHYIRTNKPKTVIQIADALELSTSSVYRALYTLMHYRVGLDVIDRVVWAGAEGNHQVPPKELERILETAIPFVVSTFEEDVAKISKSKAAEVKQPVVIERPTDTVDVMAMVIKAAKAGDGDAAVKLAQMADLMKKYA